MRKPTRHKIKQFLKIFTAVAIPTLLFLFVFLSRFLLYERTGNAYYIGLGLLAVPTAFAFLLVVSPRLIQRK